MQANSIRPPSRIAVETETAEQTRRLAAALSPVLVPGDLIVLSGDLGAGKTTFVQGLAAGLGIHEQVTSPTFILMREYTGGRFPLMHLDVYRLDRIQDVIDLGYDDFLDPSHIVVVEWGEVVEPILPKHHLTVFIRHLGDDRRRIEISPSVGGTWTERIPRVRDLWEEIGQVGDVEI